MMEIVLRLASRWLGRAFPQATAGQWLALATFLFLLIVADLQAQKLYPFNDQQLKYGFMDSLGNVRIAAQFDDARQFNVQGLSCVEKNGRFGLIDRTGAFVVEPKYETVIYFDEQCELAVVRRNDRSGFIDLHGEEVIPLKFRHAFNFDRSGLALVQIQSGKWNYIDRKGNLLLSDPVNEGAAFGDEPLASVRIEDKWGFVNTQGKLVIEPKFDRTIGFDESGLAAVMVKGKWGYIDEHGKFRIKPRFDDAGCFFRSELAPVSQDGDYFYIDKKGKKKIEGPFTAAEEFGAWIAGEDVDIAAIGIGRKYGVIDQTGKVLIEPAYDRVTILGLNDIVVSVNGKDGLMNRAGELIVDPVLFSIYPFDENGIARVVFGNGERVGAINREGEFLNEGH